MMISSGCCGGRCSAMLVLVVFLLILLFVTTTTTTTAFVPNAPLQQRQLPQRRIEAATFNAARTAFSSDAFFCQSASSSPPFFSRRVVVLRNDESSGSSGETTTSDTVDSSTDTSTKTSSSSYEECLSILRQAAVDKTSQDPEDVYEALVTLEQVQRQRAKTDPEVATDMLTNLNGQWRLIFTTGTVETQKKIKGRVNYFPLKAIQSFDTTNMTISNAIYVGDWKVVEFSGDFDFDLTKRKLEFDFDTLGMFGGSINIPLQQGQAAQIGASSGLGSEANVQLAQKQQRRAFFNWISADETIATARGGGGGLALWKRV